MLQAIFPRSGVQERPFEPPITKKDSCQAEQFLDVGLMLGDVFGCFGCQDLLQLDAALCSFMVIRFISSVSMRVLFLSEEFIDLVRAQIEKILTGRASQKTQKTNASLAPAERSEKIKRTWFITQSSQ